jgi:hypothetical protein
MNKKQQIRAEFRAAVFKRDGFRCICCGRKGKDRQYICERRLSPSVRIVEGIFIDAHHITKRSEMPCGGYVKENGATLCDTCHYKAESYLTNGTGEEGFSPKDLYTKIGSSLEQAIQASECLS